MLKVSLNVLGLSVCCLFCFQNRASLCSPGCHETCSIRLARNPRNPPVSAYQRKSGIKGVCAPCATTRQLTQTLDVFKRLNFKDCGILKFEICTILLYRCYYNILGQERKGYGLTMMGWWAASWEGVTVLACFMSTPLKLEPLGKTGPQLIKCSTRWACRQACGAFSQFLRFPARTPRSYTLLCKAQRLQWRPQNVGNAKTMEFLPRNYTGTKWNLHRREATWASGGRAGGAVLLKSPEPRSFYYKAQKLTELQNLLCGPSGMDLTLCPNFSCYVPTPSFWKGNIYSMLLCVGSVYLGFYCITLYTCVSVCVC